MPASSRHPARGMGHGSAVARGCTDRLGFPREQPVTTSRDVPRSGPLLAADGRAGDHAVDILAHGACSEAMWGRGDDLRRFESVRGRHETTHRRERADGAVWMAGLCRGTRRALRMAETPAADVPSLTDEYHAAIVH
jgi:hypothetical protein